MAIPTTTTAKYDMRYNPVYQVDCQIAASGKMVAASKRRIRWKFGFSDRASIDQGLKGPNCRGEEHEVVMVWSLTSGKQLVLADGQEVYFASARVTDKFETGWTMQGGHQIKVIAYAAPPLFPTPGFRQFDLLIDGLSYFDMPRIFELGNTTTASPPRTVSPRLVSPTVHGFDQYQSSRPQSFRQPSMDEMSASSHGLRTVRSAPATTRPNDIQRAEPLLDLVSDPAPATGSQDFMSVPMLPSPTSVMDDPFAPVEPEKFQPTFQHKANEILNAYGPPPAESNGVLALANEPHTHWKQFQPPMLQTSDLANEPSYGQAMVTPDYSAGQYAPTYCSESVEVTYCETPTQGDNNFTPVVHQSMAPLDLAGLDDCRDDDQRPEVDKALNNLVNMDDITEIKKSPEERKTFEKREANNTYTSKPLPPTAAASGWYVGPSASLNDIKENGPKKQPTKEIMRTHAFDPAAAQAGMMVVYGSAPNAQQQFDHGYGGFGMPMVQQRPTFAAY